MPSFLGEYPGAAQNRPAKFMRAVDSFIANTYSNKHLIIVSDGCKKTAKLYAKYFKGHSNVNCIVIPKQPLFSGNVRQAGIDYFTARGMNVDIFCGLDNDDFIWPMHLESIVNGFGDNDFVYFDDYWFLEANPNKFGRHPVELKKDVIGTSSIAWRNKPEFSWSGCNEWAHDWLYISEVLVPNSTKYSKIDNTGYVICHIKGMFDN